jgi:hypothetical protein
VNKRPFLFFFGFFFLCLAAPMCGLLIPYTANSSANRVERLTPLPVAILEDSERGREVLVEGRVSSRNPAQYESFVAYVREEREVETNDEGTPTAGSWEETRRVTPPLLLELSDGLVQIGNNDYNLGNARTVERRSFLEDREIRYKGFEAHDQVIAVGSLFSTAEQPQINAEFIHRGTQASYVASNRQAATMGCVGGVVSAVVGGGLVLWGLATRLFPRRPWRFIR